MTFPTFIHTYYGCGLAEEIQHQKITFAFAIKNPDNSYTNKTSFVHCRDFLNDVILMDELKDSFEVYNFIYNPNRYSDTNPALNLVINLPQEELDELQKNLHYLHKLEKYYDVEFTKLTPLKYNDLQSNQLYNYKPSYQTILITASSFWKKHTVTLSLFTAMIRIFTNTFEKTSDTFWENISKKQDKYGSIVKDGHLMQRIFSYPQYKDTFKNLLIHLKELCSNTNIVDQLEGMDIKEERYDIHEQLGFYSFTIKGTTNIDLFNKLHTIVENNKNNKELLLCLEDVKDVIPS